LQRWLWWPRTRRKFDPKFDPKKWLEFLAFDLYGIPV
jgi:hypothetical protein